MTPSSVRPPAVPSTSLFSPKISSLIMEPTMAAAALTTAGFKKSHLPVWKMIILALLAGGYVAYGCQTLENIFAPGGADNAWIAGNSTTYVEASGVLKFTGGVIFSSGLVTMNILGAELFTGNVLILMAVLDGTVTWKEMFFDWFVVYIANFFGSITMTSIYYAAGANGYYYSVAANDTDNLDKVMTRSGVQACALAAKKANMRPHEIFFTSISANFVVCLAIIMAISAKSAVGKFAVCAMPIGVFVACGWNHCIANQSFFTMATLLNCGNGENMSRYWLNLLLTTLGNIVGSAALAVSYWAVYVVDSPHEDLHHPQFSDHITNNNNNQKYVRAAPKPTFAQRNQDPHFLRVPSRHKKEASLVEE